MIVYHGSNANFSKLRIAPRLSGNCSTVLNEGYGIYFSLDKNIALTYGKYLYTLNVNDKILKSYRTFNSCLKLVKYILASAETATGAEVMRYVNYRDVASNLYKCNLAFNKLSKELFLLLDSNYEFYNRYTDTVREKIYRKIRVTAKGLLKAYLFNYYIPDIGVLKDVRPDVVSIVRKESV